MDLVRAGFRFWWQDAVAIVLCALVTGLSWQLLGSVALLFPVTLGHFWARLNPGYTDGSWGSESETR
jgi:hypothetical protein